MHACPKCRRVLAYAVRDSWCSRCLDARTRPVADSFGEEETRPGIAPDQLRLQRVRGC